ncbi:F0F1 ATP synthase subunit B [Atribacter laminatus]|uniref:ATP synthase subunit b n=1 Tax=Atribacter laminatus TaxID=2847778 RepID=A0A7T1AMW7_ATRLM|nr:F0F1 ATP synthase subunit B [Atribacter laminatus]QPM68857.1 ATP synthase subunit b, sodium ion specific [Atribacter laminatus]
MISIDRSIIFQIINFLILVALLFRFLFKPVVQALDKRSNHIREEMEKIEKEKKAAEELRLKYEEESKNIHIKYQEMQEYANQEAVKIKSKIIDEAYQESEKIKQTAEEKARIEIDKLYSDLKLDIIDISTEMAAKLLHERIDISKQDQLIEQLLEEAINKIEIKTDVQHGKQ